MNDLEAFVKPFVERLDKAVINLADYLVKQRNNQYQWKKLLNKPKQLYIKIQMKSKTMYNNSLEAFVEPFVKERLDKAVTNLAKYFIEQSHNQISMEEAKKQAESILLKDSEKK